MLNQKELIKKVKDYNRFLNPDTLSKAYNFAVEAHKNQKRDAGDPYIIHPVAVASILTELKLDSATITTGLLHDTIEDTKTTYQTVEKEFGKEVADLVDGVTKISQLEGKIISNSKVENFRKLILATSKDIRVLLVKLADRLHNMRTLSSVPNLQKRIRKAKETMEIFAPLADRMGMNSIRDELEDLSFQKLNPEARNLVVERLSKNKQNRENSFKEISKNFIQVLKNSGVNAKIVGREKTPFSKISLIAKDSQVPFSLDCMIIEKGEQCQASLEINAELNMMMKMMVEKPLTQFLEALASKMANF